MPIKGKKVYVTKGVNRGVFGTCTHADRDSLRIAQDITDLLEVGIFDRIENVVVAEKTPESSGGQRNGLGG